MNQETVTNLLAAFITVALIGSVLFAIRQIGEVVVQGIKLMNYFERKRLNKITEKLENEEARIAEEVEPKFELWWREEGMRTLEASPTLMQSFGDPDDASQVPGGMLAAMMKDSAILAITHNAFEFAVHLASSAAHKVYLSELRRVDRKQADSMAKDYEKHLDTHRGELIKVGINVDEFERQFSA